MKPQRLATSAIVILAAVSSGLAVAPLSSVAAATSGFCAAGKTYSGTTITWSGKGNGTTWTDAANWSPATVPDVHQTGGTYQAQYVCIGDGKGGKPANVTIAGTEAFHVAGLDLGQSAHLTVRPGGRLFLGAASGTAVTPSVVEKHSQLQLLAATVGGSSPLTIAGTMLWTGDLISGHKDTATQTSSECVFDPATAGCPGTTKPGGGRTIIAAGGRLLVDGTAFGGVDLTDQRVIDNSGTITLTGFGYIAMDHGTQLIDEAHSTINFDGKGGIYRLTNTAGVAPKIKQLGKVVRHGTGTSVAVVAVPLAFGGKPNVAVLGGTLVLDTTKAPNAPVERASGYGVGSCVLVKITLCSGTYPTAAEPQVALVQTSSESASPKVSRIAAALVKAPAKIGGHTVLGQAINVVGPTKKTTHSTHLTFMYDVHTAGLKSTTKPTVYRGTHAIPLCAVHGLTAINTSCVFSEAINHKGNAQTKGELTVFIITIQPEARWIVAN
jgi:hypothetical protein